MEIIINGEVKSVQEKLTAMQLLKDLGMAEKKLALEVNQEVVPRRMLAHHLLQAGDTVEIIHAIGGG
ncbi:MAG: sulfur carrier protein ThiS [Pseudomonadota bacterium]